MKVFGLAAAHRRATYRLHGAARARIVGGANAIVATGRLFTADVAGTPPAGATTAGFGRTLLRMLVGGVAAGGVWGPSLGVLGTSIRRDDLEWMNGCFQHFGLRSNLVIWLYWPVVGAGSIVSFRMARRVAPSISYLKGALALPMLLGSFTWSLLVSPWSFPSFLAMGAQAEIEQMAKWEWEKMSQPDDDAAAPSTPAERELQMERTVAQMQREIEQLKTPRSLQRGSVSEGSVPEAVSPGHKRLTTTYVEAWAEATCWHRAAMFEYLASYHARVCGEPPSMQDEEVIRMICVYLAPWPPSR
eukprot:COSAG06_NODE_4652_length_4066_cov_6.628183_3_plen_302_part_00